MVGIDAFTDYYTARDKEANLARPPASPGFELVEADLSDRAARPLAGGRPVVFHLAAQPGVRAQLR